MKPEQKWRWQTEKQMQWNLKAGDDDTLTTKTRRRGRSEHELISSVMLGFDRMSVNASSSCSSP